MNSSFDIVVVGTGITGLAVATLLAHSNNCDQINIIVVGASNRPTFDLSNEVALRVSAIAPGSADFVPAISIAVP